jgi:hypothetical protein
MSGAIHPLPPYAFMVWCLVKKHRDNFTFIFFTDGVKTTILLQGVRKNLY